MDNIAGSMKPVPHEIQQRQIAHFAKCDPAYGAGVAKRLGIEQPQAPRNSRSEASRWSS